MLYKEFTVNGETYKLRLGTRDTIQLEKAIGCNPISIFGDGDRVPTITEMVYILFYSLQALNHSINLDKTYTIFDNWLADGHTVTDFIQIIIDIYRVSGIVSNTEEEVKNA